MTETECGSRIITSPGAEFAETALFWEGCPTILRTPGGKFFAGWYGGGTREPSPYNCNLLRSSSDGGRTWGPPELVIAGIPEARSRAIDIQLWLDPRGRMWLFWTQRDDNFAADDPRHLHTWALVCAHPDAPRPEWEGPRHCANGFVRCAPTALSNGAWLLCAYDWRGDRYHYCESRDEGCTWEPRTGGRKLPTRFDETMVLERRTPGELLMFARSNCGRYALSRSQDYGATWSPAAPGPLTAADSRLFVRRLRSGRVLLILNNHEIIHRRDMCAFLSDDDGETFPHRLLLDPRDAVSYPDAVEDETGAITVVYDHLRMPNGEILLSRFREADILAGQFVSADALSFGEAFSAALTSISNVGPGIGALGPTSNFGALSDLSTFVLTWTMLLGRLEIIPVLVLFFPALWRHK